MLTKKIFKYSKFTNRTFKYIQFYKFANQISKYIKKYQNYESNIRIYSFGQNSIILFEYWIFEEQYSNIKIYSNIHPSLSDLNDTEFKDLYHLGWGRGHLTQTTKG